MSAVRLDRKLNEYIAKSDFVQAEIEKHGKRVAVRARTLLDRAPQHRTGDSRILYERHGPDRYIILSDERGLGAAMSIEYGRVIGTTSSWGPMAGLFILHRALEG